MAADYPFGVGVGKSPQLVGNYDQQLAGLDTHNTYLRCLTDMGFHGLFILCLLIVNYFRTLGIVARLANQLENASDYHWHIYGLKVAMFSFLVVVTFVSATYTEEFYWILMFPVMLKRSVENQILLKTESVDT